MSVYIMKSAFRSCKPCSHLNHDLGFKERPSQLSSNISCTSKDILLKFLLAGDLVKTSELLPSFDLIELGLAHRLAVLGVQAIHFLLQQVSVAVCILALLSLAVSALLPQQPPLLPHLLHPALVVIRAFLLGARSALWLLFVFSRLDTDVAKVLKPYWCEVSLTPCYKKYNVQPLPVGKQQPAEPTGATSSSSFVRPWRRWGWAGGTPRSAHPPDSRGFRTWPWSGRRRGCWGEPVSLRWVEWLEMIRRLKISIFCLPLKHI